MDAIAVIEPTIERNVVELIVAAHTVTTSLRPVFQSLQFIPDALTSGNPRVHPALGRLCHALIEAGATKISVPLCGRCKVQNPSNGSVDRVYMCHTCFKHATAEECTRCGKTAPIARRRDNEKICRTCDESDPATWRTCSSCNERGLIVCRNNGKPLCKICYERPRVTAACSVCHRVRDVWRKRDGRWICAGCNGGPPSLCSICGKLKSLAVRATDSTPAICKGCYEIPKHKCSRCGDERRSRWLGDERVCYRCEPLPPIECALCNNQREPMANWPLGRVCKKCYKTTLNEKRQCAACATVTPLIALDVQNRRICGPCAGVKPPKACKHCGAIEELYETSTCARCALARRLRAPFQEHGRISQYAERVFEAIEETSNPWDTIVWLGRAKSARLLISLLRQHEELTHDIFDNLPPGQPSNFARELLVRLNLLPPYDRYAKRLELWIDRTMDSLEHSGLAIKVNDIKLLRRFVSWSVLRSARQRSEEKALTFHSIVQSRRQILEPIKLMRLLASQDRSLFDLTQGELDDWVSDGPTTRREARHFFSWAHRKKALHRLEIQKEPRSLPKTIPLDGDERWATVRRLLHDNSIDIDLRVVGLLVLIYGQLLTRVARIQKRDIVVDADDVYLQQRKERLRLGPGVADLVKKLIAVERKRGVVDQYVESPWLFPGLLPASHVQPTQFSARLSTIGIDVRAARTCAMIDLSAKIPATVLADMLDIDITTAVKWAALARPDHARYVARRAAQYEHAKPLGQGNSTS